MNSGIYEIRNEVSGKRYVGSTGNFQRRWSQHLGSLRGGYHSNPDLQSDWNKHGEAVFKFTPLFLCARQDLKGTEQRFITAPVNGNYNIAFTCRRYSIEGRKAMSDSLKKPYPSFVDPFGTIHSAGENLLAFCRKHGLVQPAMWRVAHGKRGQHKGWMLWVS